MEQTQMIINAICTVGFPIVACSVMWWSNNNTQKELKESIDNMNDSLIKILEHFRKEYEYED